MNDRYLKRYLWPRLFFFFFFFFFCDPTSSAIKIGSASAGRIDPLLVFCSLFFCHLFFFLPATSCCLFNLSASTPRRRRRRRRRRRWRRRICNAAPFPVGGTSGGQFEYDSHSGPDLVAAGVANERRRGLDQCHLSGFLGGRRR